MPTGYYYALAMGIALISLDETVCEALADLVSGATRPPHQRRNPRHPYTGPSRRTRLKRAGVPTTNPVTIIGHRVRT